MALLAAAPAALTGQEPRERTPPADTVPAPEDTVPRPDAPRPPAPRALPPIVSPGPTGFAAGVWEWDRAALLMLPDLSLLHLLERIPGFVPVRTYPAGQPEAAAVFGTATGAVTWIVDGFQLDPLTTPTFDPTRLALVAVERVRVERRVTGATVRITTLSPTDRRPQSIIEAATGDHGVNLFRGTFLAPRVLGGPLALGFERLASEGGQGQSVNNTVGWVKWAWTGEQGGIEADYRLSEMDRAGVGPGVSAARRDWAVRGRRLLGPATAELYAGSSSTEDVVGDLLLREGTPRGGLRLSSPIPGPVPAHGTAALRLRSHPRLPGRELELAAWADPMPWVGVGAEAVQGWWEDGEPTGRWQARAHAGPLLGVTAFAALFGGSSPFGGGDADFRAARIDAPHLELSRRGLRAGAELAHRGFVFGAAAIRAAADSVPGFGLEFDPTAPAFAGGEASGVEAQVRIPTGWPPLRIEGWYVRMSAPDGWLYLPDDHWRVSFSYDHVPLPSGNLEIRARAGYLFRGRMYVPDMDDAGTVARVGAIRSADLELTIRVLDVHAFIRWENVLNRRLERDLPQRFRPGQNAVYGVKWHFWN